MEISRSKTKVSTVTLVLMLTITATLIASMSSVKAEDVTTYAYMSINPNPVGVSQYVDVIVWLQPIPPTGSDVFHGFMVTITDPEGTPVEIGPLNTSAIGSQYFSYTPAMVGTYKFQFTYPGETFPTGANYLPSQTPVQELVVQQDPIEPWPETPLPTDYWERPINARNREWWSISGNWLQRGYNSICQPIEHSDSATAFNPYSQAPRSAHVAWSKELALGGLAGGEFGTTSYYAGLTYEAKLTPPIIMNGKLYYRTYPSDFGIGQGVGGQWPGTICVDLRTGEEVWRNDDLNLDVGQLYNLVSGNQMGTIPYLWDLGTGAAFSLMMGLFPGDTYKMYDANTGELIASFVNATAIPVHGYGTILRGDDGALYIYTLIGPAGQMMMWNSTKAFVGAGMIPDIPGSHVPFIRNKRGTYNWSLGIEWVRPVPTRTVMGPEGPVFPAIVGTTGDVIVAAVETTSDSYLQIGYSAETGEELWVHDAPAYFFSRVFGEGIFAAWNPPTRTWFGFDAETGNQIWTSDPTDYPWGAYGLQGVIAYGKLYVLSFDGSVHCFDINTGKEVFKYFSGNAGRETPYGTWPFYWGPIIADGVVFAANGEHSPTQPLYRGTKLHAFDANTGAPIWNISGWWPIQALADGYLVTYNAEDNRMYVFGKGPTATTVSVSDGVIANGETVLIEGTVTDQSPGQPGTPCVSKDSMGAWMEYLHMQQECPMDTTGVPLTLEAFGADGSYIDIGTVTSDVNGFRYEWTPPDEGLYTILATFNGDESYGVSWGATGLSVGPAPEVPVAPAVQEDIDQAVDSLTPILYGTIVAVAVAIVIGIVNLWALRKRT